MYSGQGSIYSQGVNFSSFVQGGVDARTGQYTASLVLYEAPAYVRNCAHFQLSLRFNPLNTEDIGFGLGWSLNLSQYHHLEPRTLSLCTGEQYQVTQAGGSLVIKDQKLQTFKFTKEGPEFHITHKDGHIEVLSNHNNAWATSVPVTLYAANGHSLSLVWTSSGNKPRLSRICDGSEVLLEINYSYPRVTVVCAPGTAETATTTLVLKNNRLTEHWLPLAGDPKWKFDYNLFGNILCIDHVSSPVGLVEKIGYTDIGHTLPSGAPYSHVPVVSQHTATPGGSQPAIRTLYKYSRNNFFGFGAVDQWNEGEDNLYRVRDDYQYSSTVSLDGGPYTTYTYNKFHLLVNMVQSQNGKQIKQTITYHALKDVALEFQPPNFQLPKSVQTTYLDSANPSVARDEWTFHEFDEWGNPTFDKQIDGRETKRIYYPPQGENDKCPPDPHGFQRHVKEETIKPGKNDYQEPTRVTCHTYCMIPIDAGSLSASFVLAQQSQASEDGGRPICSIERSYVQDPAERDHGRIQQQIIKLYDKHPMVHTYEYQYPKSGLFTEIKEVQSFDGFRVRDVTTYSMSQGLIKDYIDESDVEYKFGYDLIGRQVNAVVAPDTPHEIIQTHEYSMLDGEAGSTLTVTDVKGLKTQYTKDGLERIYQVIKQDDDGEWVNGSYTGTARIIYEKNYNSLGQCIMTSEVDWFRVEEGSKKQSCIKKFKYDDWGYVCEVIDGNGVVTSAISDPITQTYTETIGGQGKKKAYFEVKDRLIQTALFKRDSTLYSSTTYTNDGWGRKVQETSASGYVTKYRYDSFNRISQTTWPDNRVVMTEYASHSADPLPESIQVQGINLGQQPFDGLCRPKSHIIGGRSTVLCYQGISPKPSDITTPMKEHFQLKYDPVLSYALQDIKGINPHSYQHDLQTGSVIGGNTPYSTEKLNYFPSGLLKSEEITIRDAKSFNTEYVYSMNGKLQQYLNAHSKSQTLDYDGHGRLQKLSQGPVTVRMDYNDESLLCRTHVSDARGKEDLTTDIYYDEFGREDKRVISKGLVTLFSLWQSYDVQHRISCRDLKDSSSQLLRHESFEYDGMGRLVSYDVSGDQAPVDQHGRTVQHQKYRFTKFGSLEEVSTTFADGGHNTTVYTYSKADPSQVIQITNTQPQEEIDLIYDGNGCLIRDEKGQHLEYDGLSRLKTVRDAHQNILSQYYYDASGRLLCQTVPGKPDHYLHYRGNVFVAATSGETKISYVSHEDQYWGQIAEDSNETTVQLWASNAHHSTIAWLDPIQSCEAHLQSYTPYGFCTTGSAIGWNGQWRDPVTGWYHLGNGYRVYNPVLMRFHSPDSLCPFTSGEIDAYAYCLSDPINRLDVDGHSSSFPIGIKWRTIVQTLVGFALSALAAIFTGGASLAVKVGVDITVAVVSSVSSGAAYDAAAGTTPTWGSVGIDGLFAAAGTVVGLGIAKGSPIVSKFSKAKASNGVGAVEKLSTRRAAGWRSVSPKTIATKGIQVARHLDINLENFGFGQMGQTSVKELGLQGTGASGLQSRIGTLRERKHRAVDETSVEGQRNSSRAMLQRYVDIRDMVRHEHDHSNDEKKQSNDASIERLKGVRTEQLEIGLSKGERVTFTVDQEAPLIFVLGNNNPV